MSSSAEPLEGGTYRRTVRVFDSRYMLQPLYRFPSRHERKYKSLFTLEHELTTKPSALPGVIVG